MRAMDPPGGRKRHRYPVARVGGLVILPSIVIPLLLFVHLSPTMKGLLAGGLLVFILGFLDDVYDVPYYAKFLTQLLAVILFLVLSKLRTAPLTFLGASADFGYLYYPIIIIWMLGVMNAFNLIDGMDALAGGVGFIVFSTFAYLFYSSGQPEELLISVVLVGAVLGFIRNNLPPARIFLGDSGSLFLGFMMAALGIVYAAGRGGTFSLTIPVLVVFLPVLDTLYVMAHRIWQRKNPFLPDRHHLHHILLDFSIEHFHVVLIIYLMALSFCVLAVLSQVLANWMVCVLFVLLSFFTIISPRIYPFIDNSFLGTIFRFLYIKPADLILRFIRPNHYL
ncbi:putative undecaprenyl-phosphate N-acetylglucosaminyl 1-phosphate transferase [subsurface metagenome]